MRLEQVTIHQPTVEGFGQEWAAFDQRALADTEREALFNGYFSIVPEQVLNSRAVCADLGCGSGRWASLVAPRVGHLHLVDASAEALQVAKRALACRSNVSFEASDLAESRIEDGSLDFAYSLGVLHHVPDTAAAIGRLATKIKPGGGFLLYLYYRFDDRAAWFKAAWVASDVARRLVSRMPFPLRRAVCDGIAAGIYWPLARAAALLRRGQSGSWPLAFYAHRSFYVMRTDALDRFGTRLERRFTRTEIERMLIDSGFQHVRFSPAAPYWVCYATKGPA